MNKKMRFLTTLTLAMTLIGATPKANATAPATYQGAMIPCFFMTGGMLLPMCVGTLGTIMLTNAAMGTGGLALLDGETEASPVSVNTDLQELVDLQALSSEQAQQISQEISQKIQLAQGQVAFDMRGLLLKGNANQKLVQLMRDNQISRETAVYLARLSGRNL